MYVYVYARANTHIIFSSRIKAIIYIILVETTSNFNEKWKLMSDIFNEPSHIPVYYFDWLLIYRV